MRNYICTTCGHQFAESEEPPQRCPICEDDRQFVNPRGQSWTTLGELAREYHNVFKPLEPGLTAIGTEPRFAIGQRALLVQAPKGNVLWDCLSLIDEATLETIKSLGGISSLAMSHPHLFGSMVEWSRAFGDAPIYLHVDHRPWVQRSDPVIQFWEGETFELEAGLTLQRCGGHFEGSTVLLWPDGAEGLGVLLSGDTMYVTPDRRHVSFMYSYPNFIPLSASTIDSIVDKVMPLRFDRIYGHFFGLEIEADAKSVVQRSAERYKQAIGFLR
jgi:glyoxylase-like metal-dependent hydrolase (beta-lactamase superfamily II)/DNA-directed RNA polymerase subunit RPC12/RpoP